MKHSPCVFMVACLLAPLLSHAQAPAAVAPAVIVTPEDLEAGLKNAPPQQAEYNKIVKGAAAQNLKISVDINRRTHAEERGLVHDRVTEIYHIVSGGGTLKTGGTLLDPKPMVLTGESSIGPSHQGSGIDGGEIKHVGVGDWIVIPAGTPHMFTALDGTVVYAVIRVDPGQP